MSKEELHRSLDALKAEVGKLNESDDEVRRRVEALIADVERGIDDPDEEDESLTERVNHFVEQFENEHPIAKTLRRFVTALGEIGI